MGKAQDLLDKANKNHPNIVTKYDVRRIFAAMRQALLDAHMQDNFIEAYEEWLRE